MLVAATVRGKGVVSPRESFRDRRVTLQALAGRSESIPGSILRPWTTFFVALGVIVDSSLSLVMQRQGPPTIVVVALVAGFTLFAAGLAWLLARTVALSITASEEGVVVTERVLNRPWRSTRHLT